MVQKKAGKKKSFKVHMGDFDRASLMLGKLLRREDHANFMELNWHLEQIKELIARSQAGCHSSVRQAFCSNGQNQSTLNSPDSNETNQSLQEKSGSAPGPGEKGYVPLSNDLYIFCAMWNSVVSEFCLGNQLLNQNCPQEILATVVDFSSRKLFDILQDQSRQSHSKSLTFVPPVKYKSYEARSSSFSFVDNSLPRNIAQKTEKGNPASS